MPGSRGDEERTVMVQIRITPKERDRWAEHVKRHGGYLSALIREAVAQHLSRADPRQRCPHW